MEKKFTAKDFKRLEPVPPEGLERVRQILESGDLFRYATEDPEKSEAALLERDFLAEWGGGMKYALAVNSCSSAILLMLDALGVRPGDNVLVPAFTFTAVPSAVTNLGATAVLVEVNKDYKVDLIDLEHKMMTSRSKILLLSHMRGYISAMDKIVEMCREHDVVLVEDAAHALGSKWNGKLVGTFGKASCYSFQSYKIVNAGEGGMILTDDEDMMARMVLKHGAYEKLYLQHAAVRPAVFEKYLNQQPLYNMRLSNASAAIVRCQLPYVKERIRKYGEVYTRIAEKLREFPEVEFPKQDPKEERVLDSLQFRLRGFTLEMMQRFLNSVKKYGVPLAGFGADKDNARAPWNWGFIPQKPGDFPETHETLDNAVDMRITTTFTDEMIDYLVQVVREGIGKAKE